MLKEGDKVYLLHRNIKTKRPSDKLDYKKLGLFKIEKIIRLINYKFKFLIIINIYLIFYIFLLELILKGALKALRTEIKIVNLKKEYNIKTIFNY